MDDLEKGEGEKKCRICHLGLQESGIAMELGCSCRDDLAAVHKQCAEAWFKIKGNMTCEICGSTARNIVCPEATDVTQRVEEANVPPAAAQPPDPRAIWLGHRLLNFLLACLVFAFIISWIFRFNLSP
ncbi:uncharacterized protein LOC18423038 [Amborella trichopoda]|uniref:RING-CH-type domain-containing protein n=1 Tax=Amborella trichopoda TaxID=13333 RepID=W1NIS7_AMBTC|nr:uncharacterized protein LOC18423038 [Amborella trichopoda]ERM95080.1 hypothetical protein AMTR_s00009p00253970 [Amborella trichopoda]|eukprot:XP_006827664.1 uncharacterized protein LOC18423038 [Amborella trichopoda]